MQADNTFHLIAVRPTDIMNDLSPQDRQFFDEVLEEVLDASPPQVHQLLDEIPLYVEDYPAPEILAQTHVKDPRSLCGLYTGIPINKRSVWQSGVPSDVVQIFRLGVFLQSLDHNGHVDREELRRQIRITLLHELGQDPRVDADDLRESGYG